MLESNAKLQIAKKRKIDPIDWLRVKVSFEDTHPMPADI